MSHKCYATDWIPELGRYAIIIAAFQNPHTKNFTSELFVFAIDKEHQFYHGQRFNYPTLPELPKSNDIIGYRDEASIYDHALGYAEAIIHLHNEEVSKKTGNKDIVLKEWECHESGAFFVLAEIYRKYVEKLRQLVDDSESDDLREMIRSSIKVMKFCPIKSESV